MTQAAIAAAATAAIWTGSTGLEGALAAAFILRRGAAFDRFRYQVRVGLGQELPAEYGSDDFRIWFEATRRRVDLVGYTPAGVVLCEVKDHLKLRGLRQLTDYRDRWNVAPGAPAIAGLVAIARTADPGVDQVAAQLGIDIELFPPRTVTASLTSSPD